MQSKDAVDALTRTGKDLPRMHLSGSTDLVTSPPDDGNCGDGTKGPQDPTPWVWLDTHFGSKTDPPFRMACMVPPEAVCLLPVHTIRTVQTEADFVVVTERLHPIAPV